MDVTSAQLIDVLLRYHWPALGRGVDVRHGARNSDGAVLAR